MIMKILPLLALLAIGSPVLAQDRIVKVERRGGSHPYYYYETTYFNCTKNLVKGDYKLSTSMVWTRGEWESIDDWTGKLKVMGQALMDKYCK